MTSKTQFLILKIIAVIFGIMYIQSGTEFIFTHKINFIEYLPNSSAEIWTVRNLGGRLLAIGIGFILAVLFNKKETIALIFAIRLIADSVDLWNSMVTPNLASFIVPVLGVFVAIEAICLCWAFILIKKEKLINDE